MKENLFTVFFFFFKLIFSLFLFYIKYKWPVKMPFSIRVLHEKKGTKLNYLNYYIDNLAFWNGFFHWICFENKKE